MEDTLTIKLKVSELQAVVNLLEAHIATPVSILNSIREQCAPAPSESSAKVAKGQKK